MNNLSTTINAKTMQEAIAIAKYMTQQVYTVGTATASDDIACAIVIPVFGTVAIGRMYSPCQVCSIVYSYDNWMPCYPCQSDRATREMDAAVKVAWKAIEWAIGQGVAA